MGRYPLKTWIGKYMDATQGYYAPATVKVRRSTFSAIEREYAELRRKDRMLEASPEKWGEREIISLMTDMRVRGLARATQTQRLSLLKTLLEYVGNGIVSRMKAEHPHSFPRSDMERRGSLRSEDLEAILEKAGAIGGWTGESAQFVFAMYAYTGVRRNELASAHREDLNDRDWTFRVRHPKGERTYGRQRLLPIPEPLRPYCRRYLKARETVLAEKGLLDTTPLVFPKRDPTRCIATETITTWQRRVVAASGVRFSPHALRRTYGQMLVDRGVDIQTVSVMLGHSSTNTTEKHYCRKNADSARLEVIEALRNQAPRVNPPELSPPTDLPGYA